MSLIRKIVRAKFALTTRRSADGMVRPEAERTLAVGRRLGSELRGVRVTVPRMPGVDEDMRSWNFYEILEHNAIVNRRITATLLFLAGAGPAPDDAFDVKRDVMPRDDAGEEQVAAFRRSVDRHLAAVAPLAKLRGTYTADHPIFGPFDAHRWHCMFGFHLLLHRRQAEALENQGRSVTRSR